MKKGLKILFVSCEYPPETGWGGIGTYVACIGPALVKRGHEVHVLSCVYNQKHKDYVDNGVHVHRRGVVRIRGMRVFTILKIPELFNRLRIGLSAFWEHRRLGVEFDVIEYPDWGAEGWMFALFHTTPLVAHLHAPQPVICRYHNFPENRDNLWKSSLEHFAVRRADVVTSPSRLLVETLKDMGWLRELDIEIIPQPIDWFDWSSIPPVQETRPIVLFVGRVENLKAPEVLVEALSMIRRKVPNAEVLFIGGSLGHRDGLSYLEWVKQSAIEVGGCHFVGHVPRHELTHLFSKGRVLAVPSWFENFNMSTLEAMAAGRPVVVTKMNGVAELVEQAGAGRVVPTGDAKALAEALLPFLMDPTYASAVGERGKLAVRESVDPDKIAAQRETVYQKAVIRRSRQRNGVSTSISDVEPTRYTNLKSAP